MANPFRGPNLLPGNDLCQKAFIEYLSVQNPENKIEARKILSRLGWRMDEGEFYTSPSNIQFNSLCAACSYLKQSPSSSPSKSQASSLREKAMVKVEEGDSASVLREKAMVKVEEGDSASVLREKAMVKVEEGDSPEPCPQVVADWVASAAKGKAPRQLSSNVKEYMLAAGWKFKKVTKPKRKSKEMRYISPMGQTYYSLVRACKQIEKDFAGRTSHQPSSASHGMLPESVPNSVGNSVSQNVQSDIFSKNLVGSSHQQQQQPQPEPQKPQYLHHQQLRHQMSKQKLQGSIQSSVMQSHDQQQPVQQPQNLLQPTQMSNAVGQGTSMLPESVPNSVGNSVSQNVQSDIFSNSQSLYQQPHQMPSSSIGSKANTKQNAVDWHAKIYQKIEDTQGDCLVYMDDIKSIASKQNFSPGMGEMCFEDFKAIHDEVTKKYKQFKEKWASPLEPVSPQQQIQQPGGHLPSIQPQQPLQEQHQHHEQHQQQQQPLQEQHQHHEQHQQQQQPQPQPRTRTRSKLQVRKSVV